MLDPMSIPVEMRAMSVASFILFAVGTTVVAYLHTRMARIEQIVADSCVDIKRLEEMINDSEKTIKIIRTENHQFIDWVREDNTTRWDRIEDSLSEIRKQLYPARR